MKAKSWFSSNLVARKGWPPTNLPEMEGLGRRALPGKRDMELMQRSPMLLTTETLASTSPLESYKGKPGAHLGQEADIGGETTTGLQVLSYASVGREDMVGCFACWRRLR